MDRSTTCGLFGWRPSWIQRFANPKAYVIVYFIIGFFQSMISSYLTVVLSTVEKRFGLQSKEAAWIYSGNEISQICFIFFLPLVSRVKRRTLFLGVSMIITALGSFLIALPHFFGAQQLLDNLNLVGKHANGTDLFDLCLTASARDSKCSTDGEDGGSVKDVGSLVVIFAGIFSFGIGTSFYFAFGVPYIDDNTRKTESPLMLSIVFSAKTLGPSLGYVLGAACLKLWVNPWETTDFDETDPRWIGAWWIGFFVIGGLLLLSAPFMTLFPEKLPAGEAVTDAKEISKARDSVKGPQNMGEWLEEFRATALRLLTNRIWMLNLMSSMFLIFGLVGFATFLPKYFEYQFRQTASTGGGLGGISKSVASVIGMLTSGWLIGRYRFRAKTLAGFCAFGGLAVTLAFAALTMMACPSLEIYGLDAACSGGCQCKDVAYHPVCSSDGVTSFFSPCHAGCVATNKTRTVKKGVKSLYWDCSCIKNTTLDLRRDRDEPVAPLSHLGGTSGRPASSAIDGYCPLNCDGLFYSLLAILFVVALIGAGTRIPNMLINLRIIDKRDKAASLTLSLSFLSLTTLLPSPLIFGTLFDLSCKLWGERCGETTHCLVYDNDAMRVNMGSLATSCIFLGFVCDVLVWYLIGDLEIYGKDEEGEEEDEGKVAGNNNVATLDSGIDSLHADEKGMVEIELKEKDK